MAEIELSVLSNRRLNRRIGHEVVLKREVSALDYERKAIAVIDWRFSIRTLALNFNTSTQHLQIETVLEHISQAIELWLETAREFGDPIPEPKGERLMLA